MPFYKALTPCVVAGVYRKEGEIFEGALPNIPRHVVLLAGPPEPGDGAFPPPEDPPVVKTLDSDLGGVGFERL